jgi:(4-(4-[2-(gamma-L-glutamylamino)ethyl]phenoxymethyl)furan-2-yl)methanamine synthase
MHKQIGWDVGGAHLKAVLLDGNGNVMQVQQLACPLWLGLNKLETTVVAILKQFEIASGQVHHAVTMTGELVDLFSNRHEGVLQISQCITSLLGEDVLFYCMDGVSNEYGLVAIDNVAENTKMIASANWHASARLLAKNLSPALLIDIGSTTTDIILIENGKVIDRGLTDAKRMQQDMLVYTGVVRTPVMAVTQKLLLGTKETNVAAEYFATMADVYRLTEELPEALDMSETADGEPKTVAASARRLARMVGHDVEDKPLEVWRSLAQDCRERQLIQIQLAVKKHLKNGVTIVGAGAGCFLVQAIAQKLSHPYAGFTSLLRDESMHHLEVCLPAYAVAKLASLRNAIS